MLRSILSRRESRGQRGSVSSNSAAPEKESELVIETKDRSLTGVVGDLGYTGTAVAGIGSAWTRGFNMDSNTATNHQQTLAQASIRKAFRQDSSNSLELDEELFDGGATAAAPGEQPVPEEDEEEEKDETAAKGADAQTLADEGDKSEEAAKAENPQAADLAADRETPTYPDDEAEVADKAAE